MYLFSRRVRLQTGGLAEGMAWATGIAEKAHQLTGLEINVFTSMFGPGVGTIAFSAMVPDLEALETANDKLIVDNGYLEEVRRGQTFAPAGADDRLASIVHPGEQAIADMRASGQRPAYATNVTTTVVPGSFARGLSLGIEIAERVTAVTERPTMFLAERTGAYGAVSWVSGYADIHQLEESERAIDNDRDFVEFLDREAKGVYTDVPGATTQQVWRRLT